MREQHLDHYGIEYGIMNPLQPSGQGDMNTELSAAMAFAINESQLERWHRREPRLKASVIVPYEDAEASRLEIRRRAGDRSFAQVMMLSRSSEALGRKRYWPIYEAAVEAGLPVGIHAFGYSGWAMTNGGWPSFYIEEVSEHATSAQAVVSSMVMEGLFERYRDLKVVLIECGFGWLPALGWRLDKHWKRMRDEVPHLTRRAVGSDPRAFLRLHPADGGDRGSDPCARRHALDRLRPHPVRERLSALGFRRSRDGDPAEPRRRAAPHGVRRQCAGGVPARLISAIVPGPARRCHLPGICNRAIVGTVEIVAEFP